MDAFLIAGILLAAGFVLILAGPVWSPQGLFRERDPKKQVAMIEANRSRWLTFNVTWAVAGVATATGLVVLSADAADQAGALLAWSAAAAYAISTLLWILFLTRRIRDPASLYLDYTFTPSSIALLAMMVLGLILYGLIFVELDIPRWIGWGTIVVAALIGTAAAAMPKGFFKYFPPQALFLPTCVAGIALIAS